MWRIQSKAMTYLISTHTLRGNYAKISTVHTAIWQIECDSAMGFQNRNVFKSFINNQCFSLGYGAGPKSPPNAHTKKVIKLLPAEKHRGPIEVQPMSKLCTSHFIRCLCQVMRDGFTNIAKTGTQCIFHLLVRESIIQHSFCSYSYGTSMENLKIRYKYFCDAQNADCFLVVLKGRGLEIILKPRISLIFAYRFYFAEAWLTFEN